MPGNFLHFFSPSEVNTVQCTMYCLKLIWKVINLNRIVYKCE